MKTIPLTLSAFVLLAVWASPATGQARFSGHGFTSANAFHLALSGPGEVEASTNLQTWTKFATVSQETALEDLASRQMGWRFFRLRGGTASNVIGFVKLTIPAGKLAILGNAFAAPLRFDLPERRHDIFGTTNPAVKISLYANGTFVPHVLDSKSGAFSPALRPIRPQEGFTIENTGTTPLLVRLSGDVRQGQFTMAVPAGSSLLVPPVPVPAPLSKILNFSPKDGMQVDVFNEQTQAHQTSTYDSLGNKGWQPELGEYRPGRAFLFKTPEAVSWVSSYSVNAH